MLASTATLTGEYEDRLPNRVWFASIMIACAYFCTAHSVTISLDHFKEVDADEMGLSRYVRTIGDLLAGTMGLILWKYFPRRPLQLDPSLIKPFAFFTLWWCLSILWSSDKSQTTKSVVVLLGFLTVCWLLAEQLSLRDLCWVAILVSAIWIVLGYGAEIALGMFAPWDQGYRFAGTLHPNAQGPNCARVCFGVIAIAMTDWRRYRRTIQIGLVALFAFAFLTLILTKSRATLLSFVVSVAAMWICAASARTRWLTIFASLWVICSSLMFLSVFDTGIEANLEEKFMEASTMGRSDSNIQTGSSGRSDLWADVIDYYVVERPILGFGYCGFWTSERQYDVATRQGWTITSSHSTYLESILFGGVVGCVLLVWWNLAGLWRGAKICHAATNAGPAFFLGNFLFSVVNSMSEVTLVRPQIITLFVIVGYFRLAFFKNEEWTPEKATAERRTSKLPPISVPAGGMTS